MKRIIGWLLIFGLSICIAPVYAQQNSSNPSPSVAKKDVKAEAPTPPNPAYFPLDGAKKLSYTDGFGSCQDLSRFGYFIVGVHCTRSGSNVPVKIGYQFFAPKQDANQREQFKLAIQSPYQSQLYYQQLMSNTKSFYIFLRLPALFNQELLNLHIYVEKSSSASVGLSCEGVFAKTGVDSCVPKKVRLKPGQNPLFLLINK